MPKNLYTETLKWFQAVLPGQKQLCVLVRNKYGFQIGNAIEKIKLYFDQEEKLKMAWYSMHTVFLDMPIPRAQVLRLYIQMFLSCGLCVCITLETVCHRTNFGIFCNITQNTRPEENSQKMFYISSPTVLFSYGKVRDIFWIRIKFHLGRTKGRGKRGYGEEAQNEVLICKIPIIKKDTNFISQTFVQTNFPLPTIVIGMPNNLYSKTFKWFWAVLPGQKQLCIFLGPNMASK